MTLQIECETDVSFDFDYKSEAEKMINNCLDYIKCPYEAEINLIITDNPGIHEINKNFRQIDRPTDVLSFPLVEYTTPGEFDILEDNEAEYFNLDTGELMLGDIILSVDKIKEQANEYGHSELREFLFLIVHSMLHLFGFDHMIDEERIVMEEKQKEILDKAGIKR